MKTLLLRPDDFRKIAGFEGQFPTPKHARQTLKESTKVILPDGTDGAILLCDVIPRAFHKLAYELWKPVSQSPSNRATAVGSRSLLRLNNDGMLGKRRGVPKSVLRVLAEHGVAHGIIGFVDATRDRPCRKTLLTRKHSEMLQGNRPLIERVDELYKRYLRTFYARQRAEIGKVPRWRLWQTVFSTIYVAKKFRTAYHYDRGNLKGAMTALMPMGNFTGGELILPRWRISIAFKPGDLLFFDSQQELHGNLPIEGERLSAAFYCAGRIADCPK
jgi:Oxygenase domain of the 2OGFeDO superfamily